MSATDAGMSGGYDREWEVVIGIEVHVQLATETKLFCGDRPTFGSPPNTHVCPVCLGLPGALPATNPEAVRLAVRTALALGCEVHGTSVWARKNYFYPDLPKGYQITQFDRPVATGGRVSFDTEDGIGEVRIRRIHMEEDAGKSLHDRVSGATAVDLNRAGTPLVEIVTEPDLASPADTRAFLQALKQVLEYVDVSDCNMEEGSLRADANVSVRPVGEEALGTKTEIKNVNSFSGIEKALEQEIERQVALLESGGTVIQQTLLWDDHAGEIRPMRDKEESHDYRYFPDPDLLPLVLDPAEVDAIRNSIPELPRARRARFVSGYGLPDYDAGVLTLSRAGADFFEAVAEASNDPREAAKWVMGPYQAVLNERGEEGGEEVVPPRALAELVDLVADGTISHGVGKKVLGIMAREGLAAAAVVEREGLAQVRDETSLRGWVDEVMAAFPDEVERCRAGESRLLGFLMGKVMECSGRRADPHAARQLLQELLAG